VENELIVVHALIIFIIKEEDLGL